jgi:hypothetical protein
MTDHKNYYVEIAYEHVANRGVVIPLKNITSYIRAAQKAEVPLFCSYYNLTDEALEHAGDNGSMRNYKGAKSIRAIYFDIDRGDLNDEGVWQKAKTFIELLSNKWMLKESILIWYSGNGYHIQIPNVFKIKDSPTASDILKATVMKHFPQVDDIFDGTRIFRVGNTINEKTNRYKIPLTFEEFNEGYETVIELSEKPRNEFKLPMLKEIDLSDFTILPEKKFFGKPMKSAEEPSSIVTCMQTCYNKGEVVGERHQEIMRMASAYKRGGVPLQAVIAAMMAFAPSLGEDDISRIVSDVFTKNYRWSCNDKIMKKYCTDRCMFYKNKNYLPEMTDFDTLEDDYIKFMQKDFTDTSFNLNRMYPMIGSYATYPGELVVVLGDTKLGKSAWVQNLCIAYPELPFLYLSLEMSARLTFRRFVQIAHDMEKEAINEYFKAGKKGLIEPLRHIKIMTAAPKLDAISKLIIESGCKVIVIDVIDMIESPIQDANAKLGEIGVQLKAIAQKLDIIIIAIHHITKSAAMAETGLTIHSGKGGSSLEQKADKILALEGDRSTVFRRLSTLGSRDEPPFDIALKMAPHTFVFKQHFVNIKEKKNETN